MRVHGSGACALAVAVLGLLAGCSGQGSPPAPATPGPVLASEVSGEEGDLLVIFRPTVAVRDAIAQIAAEHGIEALASWKMNSLALECAVFRVGSPVRLGFIERRLTADARVESVQRNQLFELKSGARGMAASTAKDEFADLQYASRMLGLEAVHRRFSGAGTTIGVIDTGVDVAHTDLRGRVAAARSFVSHDKSFTEDRHATAVVGAMVAVKNNGIGIAGVAPGARVEVLKACWQLPDRGHAVCSSYTLALALDYAIERKFPVVNLSIGGPSDRLLERLLGRAMADGTVIVGAGAGSSGRFPSEVAGVLTATACDAEGRRWPEASDDTDDTGETDDTAVTLTVPGAEIFGLAPGGAYDFFSGDSLAGAHLAGVVALLLEARPGLSAAHLGGALLAGSRQRVAGGPRVVDACRAVLEIDPSAGLACDAVGLRQDSHSDTRFR